MSNILAYFDGLDGVGGSSMLANGGYRLDLTAGGSRLATAEEIRAAATEAAATAIKAERDRRKLTGTPVGQYVFHSDPDSRIQQLGLVMMGASMPAGIQWKTLGTGYVEMTPTLAQQIFGATATRDVQLFAVADAHIAAAAAADDPLAYDFSGGWPV